MKFIFNISYCVLFLVLTMPQAFGKHIVVIKTSPIAAVESLLDGFLSMCPGELTIDVFDMAGSNRFNDEIIETIRKKNSTQSVDLIYTIGTPATQLAYDNFSGIPMFFSMVNNPEQKGFGNNSSGITLSVPLSKQVELLQKVLPKISLLGVIYDPKNNEKLITEMKSDAQAMALNLQAYQVPSPKEVPKALRQAIKEVEALLVISDKTVINRQSLKYIVTTTLEHQLPTITYTDMLVKAGFLFGLMPSNYDMGRQAGEQICRDKELQQPANTIYEPRLLLLSINLKTAKRVSVVISEQLINEAEYVLK